MTLQELVTMLQAVINNDPRAADSQLIICQIVAADENGQPRRIGYDEQPHLN